ncbi:class I SAM-dependent DNA methyltransferase [Promineifilum sp.]|uniref:HsdM family class I SAM-dependent methyltransferase n=1 Tax=Promineifilum sp. TaxID=2664178 RepID=UPI0035B0875C
MTNKQRTWGQFATPIDVADLLLGFCLRRPEDRVLDPSCGDGALLRRAARWRSWLASGDDAPAGRLYGVELDSEAAAMARTVAGATILHANFLTLEPGSPLPGPLPGGEGASMPGGREDPLPSPLPGGEGDEWSGFDAIIGNPPYTRAEWIGRLDAAAGAQLALFSDEPADGAARPALLPRALGAGLGGRAGLHAYFFLHSAAFLREGGRLGFVAPNGWLDVAYGGPLKQFLLDHFRILAIIESAVERWFAAASVNTCVIILERTDDAPARAANRVRLARLRQPLRDLLGYEADDPRRQSAVDQLIGRLLPPADRDTAGVSARVRPQETLAAGERWGTLLRAPAVYLRPPSRPLVSLGAWAAVRRGFTSGANNFFYLDRARVERWGIEPEFRRPLLKSLRRVADLRAGREECAHDLLTIPAGARLAGTAAGDYVAWGEAQGIHRRRTCAGRTPWYALPEAAEGGLLLAKGVWQRHFAPVVVEPLVVDQQIYRVRPDDEIAPGVAAALLNSAWFALQCELRGRVNLGEGVLWLATYELAEALLPDPRTLDAGQRRALEDAAARLAARPLGETPEELARDDRRELDDLVFDLVGLPAAEREAARAALLDCLAGRRRRAGQIGAEA